MTKPLVYLDVDRTLYRTDDANMIVWRQIATWYPAIDPQEECTRGKQFRVMSPNGLYYYDFTRHIEYCDLNAEEVYAALMASPIADNQLLFPGAEELVVWLKAHARPALLTYGSDDYQRLKIALCPALNALPTYTTQQPKSEWLKSTGPCWLVDDKPIGDELPDVVRFVQVSLEGREVVTTALWPHFTSLTTLQQYFAQEFAT